jgi:hypothetical protein
MPDSPEIPQSEMPDPEAQERQEEGGKEEPEKPEALREDKTEDEPEKDERGERLEEVRRAQEEEDETREEEVRQELREHVEQEERAEGPGFTEEQVEDGKSRVAAFREALGKSKPHIKAALLRDTEFQEFILGLKPAVIAESRDYSRLLPGSYRRYGPTWRHDFMKENSQFGVLWQSSKTLAFNPQSIKKASTENYHIFEFYANISSNATLSGEPYDKDSLRRFPMVRAARSLLDGKSKELVRAELGLDDSEEATRLEKNEARDRGEQLSKEEANRIVESRTGNIKNLRAENEERIAKFKEITGLNQVLAELNGELEQSGDPERLYQNALGNRSIWETIVGGITSRYDAPNPHVSTEELFEGVDLRDELREFFKERGRSASESSGPSKKGEYSGEEEK